MKTIKLMKQVVLAAALAATTVVAGAQTSNTVVAQFGSAPSAAGNSFTINLLNTGAVTEIAGFSFRVIYNPEQATLASVSDNTGQPKSAIEYTIGAEKATGDGLVYRDILGGTLVNLKDAGNLAQLNFEKKPGYTGPLQFKVEDRVHTAAFIDGLQGPTVQNVPHDFDATQVTQ